MQQLTSIQTANRQYDTGEKPLLILCSDMHEYVCKHSHGSNGMSLLCEYLAASFLRIWQLQVPDFAFVQVHYDHVKQFHIPKHYVAKPCFGSQYSVYYQELTQYTDNPDIKKHKEYMESRFELLKIALFDLWIANEDRHFNNMNLLVDMQNSYHFVPIDHGAIFNTRTFDTKITLLTENESLTDTSLFKNLLPRKEFSKELITKLKEYFYLCSLQCKQQFHEILSFVPPCWDIDRKVIETKLSDEVFTPEWEASVINTFLDYICSPFH